MGRVVIPGFRKIETSGGGEGGTSNYNDLTNKPSINNVPLVGNLNTANLKLTDATLTEEGVPAEAKTVGQKLEEHSTSLTALSEQLGNHTVKSDVPENAVFTDTVYDDTEVKVSIAELNSNLTSEISRAKETEETLKSRIDNIASLPEGSTTADAELQDIRVKADGTIATSAGNAVREQVSELKGDLGNKNNLNTDTKSNLVGALNEVNNRFILPVEESVENWLNAHPEATTTVQDHSLNIDKMIVGTLGYVTPEMFGAIGDGVHDDTNAIKHAIIFAQNNGISTVLLGDKKYLISETIVIPSKIYLEGKNRDISVYNYNRKFENVFQTEILLAPNSNCNVIEFEIHSISNGVRGIFINGNREQNTNSNGITLTGNSNYRGRQKIENVMVYNCNGYGIYVSEHNYETEIHSTMCFYCGHGLYLAGEDCVLEEFSAGYNYGNGIEVTKHGALRAFNIDSFGNEGHGLYAYNCSALSFIKATVNGNGKDNVYFTVIGENGFLPSQVDFVNSAFFNCGDGYSEILIDNANYGMAGLSFIGCSIGTKARTNPAKYLIENNCGVKLNTNIIGGVQQLSKYNGISNAMNSVTLNGCVDSDGYLIENYNRTLKQKGGLNLQTAKYGYVSTSSILDKNISLLVVNAYGGERNITLPLAKSVTAGQLFMIVKQDTQETIVSLTPSTGNTINGKTQLSTSDRVALLSSDGENTWYVK